MNLAMGAGGMFVLLVIIGLAMTPPEPTEAPAEQLEEEQVLPAEFEEPVKSLDNKGSTEAQVRTEPAPEPITYEEQLKKDIQGNTPGLFAADTISAIPAEKLANDIFPATCEALAVNLASDVEFVLADAALKHWGADEKTAKNIAEGLVKTAIEPGRC